MRQHEHFAALPRCTFVALPGAPSEDLEQLVEGAILLLSAKCLDVRLLEQLGEDVGMRRGSSLGDEIGSGTRRCGGGGEGNLMTMRSTLAGVLPGARQ